MCGHQVSPALFIEDILLSLGMFLTSLSNMRRLSFHSFMFEKLAKQQLSQWPQKCKISLGTSNQATKSLEWLKLKSLWRQQLKKLPKDGKVSHAHGSVGLTYENCNFYLNANTILYRTWKDNSHMHLEKQKPRVAKRNSEQ